MFILHLLKFCNTEMTWQLVQEKKLVVLALH